MHPLRDLLEQSIEQYRSLHGATVALCANLGTLSGKESLAAYQRLMAQQVACQNSDEILVPMLFQGGPVPGLAALVAERFELLEKIVKENQNIMPRLLSRMAILRAELNNSREGQTAMAGYRSNGPVSGRVLRRSC